MYVSELYALGYTLNKENLLKLIHYNDIIIENEEAERIYHPHIPKVKTIVTDDYYQFRFQYAIKNVCYELLKIIPPEVITLIMSYVTYNQEIIFELPRTLKKCSTCKLIENHHKIYEIPCTAPSTCDTCNGEMSKCAIVYDIRKPRKYGYCCYKCLAVSGLICDTHKCNINDCNICYKNKLYSMTHCDGVKLRNIRVCNIENYFGNPPNYNINLFNFCKNH